MANLDDKIGKIVALAKGGVGGERTTAIKILKNLCKNHGLNYDEVMSDDQQISEYVLEYKSKEDKRLTEQIIGKYLGHVKGGYYKYRKALWFETTKEKYIEVLNAHSVLLRLYRKERKKMKEAVYYGFLDKHNLFVPAGEKERELTQEEKDARAAGHMMTYHMEDAEIHKQLNSKPE